MILPPTYTPPRGYPHERGVELDVAAAMPWIEAATACRGYEEYADPRRRDNRMDCRSFLDTCDQFVTGYKGEAAFAMHYGLPIDGLLVKAWGRPDFTFRGRNVDVKTVPMDRRWVSVRADVLGKDLATWWIVGAKSTRGGTRVTLIGYLPGLQLRGYDVTKAEDGHDKAYLRIPMDDLLAMPEVKP